MRHPAWSQGWKVTTVGDAARVRGTPGLVLLTILTRASPFPPSRCLASFWSSFPSIPLPQPTHGSARLMEAGMAGDVHQVSLQARPGSPRGRGGVVAGGGPEAGPPRASKYTSGSKIGNVCFRKRASAHEEAERSGALARVPPRSFTLPGPRPAAGAVTAAPRPGRWCLR